MSIKARRGLLLVALMVAVSALVLSVAVNSPTEAQSLDTQQASAPPAEASTIEMTTPEATAAEPSSPSPDTQQASAPPAETVSAETTTQSPETQQQASTSPRSVTPEVIDHQEDTPIGESTTARSLALTEESGCTDPTYFCVPDGRIRYIFSDYGFCKSTGELDWDDGSQPEEINIPWLSSGVYSSWHQYEPGKYTVKWTFPPGYNLFAPDPNVPDPINCPGYSGTDRIEVPPQQCEAGIGTQDGVEPSRAPESFASASSAQCSVVIGTKDNIEPAIETSTLEVKSVGGLGCSIDGSGGTTACKFEWLRSEKQEDASYTLISPLQSPQYILAKGDVGHRFKVRATDPDTGATTESSAMAVGPSNKPQLVHPVSAPPDPVRVEQPFFNVTNVTHDTHTPANPPGSYKYDVQVSSDNTFPDGGTLALNDVAERTSNNDISYGQIDTELTPGTTYYWRARAKVENAPGRWSNAESFTVAAANDIWSKDGETWHWPLDNAGARLSGTFMEAFHSGYLQTRLHGGIDVAVGGVPVRAARNGIRQGDLAHLRLDPVGAVRLLHNGPDEETNYLHMINRPLLTDLPLGTMINQGTRLGTASDVGIPGAHHLHFDRANLGQTEYLNPLALNLEGWNPPPSADPTVSRIYLRSDRFLGSNRTGIGGPVSVIARTVDPATAVAPPPAGQRLAPYRVQFSVQPSGGGNPVDHEIRFDSFTAGNHERDFYAYENDAAARINTPPYLMHFSWNGARNDSPYTITTQASDFQGNTSPDSSITIGPEVTTDTPRVCGPLPQQVRVRIANRNNGLEPLPRPFNGQDQYDVALATNNVQARLIGRPQRQIVDGREDIVNVNIPRLEGAQGRVTLTARSGIVTDISDTVTIDVVRDCP